MRLQLFSTLLTAVVLTPAALAQKWEFGGGAGGSFYTSQDVTSAAGSGSVKINSGLAASGWLANNNGSRWGGELRYDFEMGDLQVSSSGTSAGFAAQSHAVHYDLTFHTAPRNAKIRPFVAFGGGVKRYQGTGTEAAYQPLYRLALLTKTSDTKPLASVGAGVKFNYRRMGFRIEVHDYATPFPTKVIAPAQGAKIGGWLHDFVVGFGVSALARAE